MRGRRADETKENSSAEGMKMDSATKWKISGPVQEADIMERRRCCESQMSLLRAERDGAARLPALRPSYHHDGLLLRRLRQLSLQLHRLPREHQVFELVNIRGAAAAILVLSGTYENLQS